MTVCGYKSFHLPALIQDLLAQIVVALELLLYLGSNKTIERTNATNALRISTPTQNSIRIQHLPRGFRI